MAKKTLDQNASISIHRAVSLEFVKISGGFAVRVKYGEKAPVESTDFRNANPTKSEHLLREMANTNDNVGLHTFDNLVDIDVDSDDPNLKAALDYFLPSCSHVWGRPSRPRTHYVYAIRGEPFDPDMHPILTRLKAIRNGERLLPEVNVELRGGQKSRGVYSLLPGSVLLPKPGSDIKEPEEYLWADLGAARSSPSTTDVMTLLSAIRLAGAVAVIAPYWVEGMRHAVCLPLIGLLHRIAGYAEDFDPDNQFRMDREMAERLLRAVMAIAGDDPSDMNARIQSFDSTWRKGDNGQKIKGGTTLNEVTGSDTLRDKLYMLLSDVSGLDEVEWFVQKFAIWQGPGVVIDMEGPNVLKDVMTRTQFNNSWGHRRLRTDKGAPLISEMLFSMKTTERIAGLTFDPSTNSRIVGTPEGNKLNQWTGHAVPPHREPVTDEEVAPFLEYVRVVLGNNEPVRHDWVMSWLSHIFQQPNKKCGTALVLIGLPGTGKSFIGHNFIRKIIGQHHTAIFDDVNKLTGNFNVYSDNKLFVQLDEATNNRQHIAAGRLKTMITDEHVLIEPKFVNSYEKPNYRRFLFTSNEDNAIFIPDGANDRRFTILRVHPVWLGENDEEKKRNQKEHWTPLGEWAEDVTNLAKVHRYLLDYPCNWELIKQPLHSEERVAMGQASMNVFDRWLARWMADCHPLSLASHQFWHEAPVGEEERIDRTEWPTHVNMTTLAEDYTRFARSVPGRDKETQMNPVHIRSELKVRGIVSVGKVRRLSVVDTDLKTSIVTRKRVWVYPIPTMEEIDKFLKFRYGASYLAELQSDDAPATVLDPDANKEY